MTEESEAKEEEFITLCFLMGFLTMLILYTFVGLYMEKRKFSFGHETGVILLIGIGLSYTVKYFEPEALELLKFDDHIFFEYCLPLIIFASGYNMKRKRFFENMTNLTKFGLVGTLITFLAYSSMTYAMFELFNMTYFD